MTSDSIKTSPIDLGAARQGFDDARQTASETAAKAGSRAHGMADQAADVASDLYERAKGTIRDASGAMPDSAADAIAAGQRAVDEGTARLSRQVAKQPIEALILAGAIGYLVGWATSRG
jgi:ElaB/YqjD/DUF883 family membrane-anchored ribosome-binding protein